MPIGSNGKGYFWAKSSEELDNTIQHLKQRINSQNEVKTALESTKSRIGGDIGYKVDENSQVGINLQL